MVARACRSAERTGTAERRSGRLGRATTYPLLVAVSAQRWTEPGAHPVVPGVFRLPLPLPGDGLRAVNVYAMEDGDGVVLIDAGWHREDSWDQLDRGLRQMGAVIGDVRKVLVTHIHHDHYGQAPRLRDAAGAVVVLGRGEQRSFEAITASGQSAAHADRIARLVQNGGAELLAEIDALEGAFPSGATRGHAIWEPPDVWAAEGSPIELTDRVLDPIETPGHTRGHLTFFDRERGLLFAGDHVLPHITPSLGLEPFADGLPLVDFILSLLHVRDLPARAVLPAHGDVFTDLPGRVEALLDHHATRLAACVGAVRSRERTAFEVAELLPWTRRQTAFNDLDLFNRLLAVGETAAHLDLLVIQGSLSAREDGAVRRYQAASEPG
jgi:glyoxylase-like metal-dependent hydrolase (beta-lactamase superfamily II)